MTAERASVAEPTAPAFGRAYRTGPAGRFGSRPRGPEAGEREDTLGRRYLVTGGAGFVGASVVRALLARGDYVTVIDTGAAAGFGYLDGTDATVVRADIADAGAVARALGGCAGIVHLAAQVSVPLSIERPLDDLRANVTGSLGLLEEARRQGVARIVFASSNAVVAGHPPPAHEDLVPRPVAPYGAAKAAIEAYLRAYHAAHGLETVSLRFANAYGPWSAHKRSAVAAFVGDYLAGRPLTVRGDGDQTRDFVHVSDLVDLVLLCLELPADRVAGEVFQAGTGRETSINELLALIFELGGAAAPVRREPASPGDVRRNYSSIEKAARVLGHRPHVELRDGLAETMEWFRNHVNG